MVICEKNLIFIPNSKVEFFIEYKEIFDFSYFLLKKKYKSILKFEEIEKY